MLVKEIFEHLAQGELRTLALGNMDDGGVIRSNYDKIIPHINMAVIEIYKRQTIEKTVDIQCDLSMTEYKLDALYSQTTGSAPIKYIMDTPSKPFQNDVLKIECITGKVINRPSDSNAITVQDDYLILPLPTDELIEVGYRAKLPTIPVIGFDIETAKLELPYAYLSALLNYVGMRITTGMPPKEGVSDSNTFLARFEANMTEIDILGLNKTDNEVNYKAVNRGWV